MVTDIFTVHHQSIAHSVPFPQVYRLMNDVPSALADLDKAIELSRGTWYRDMCCFTCAVGIVENEQRTDPCAALL